MRVNRFKALGIAILFMILFLMGRLAQIQLFQTAHFSKQKIDLLQNSVAQRRQEFEIDDGRGHFLDRDGEPLTFTERGAVIIFPFLHHIDNVKTVAKLLHISEQSLLKSLAAVETPAMLNEELVPSLSDRQIKQLNDLNIPGIYGLTLRSKPILLPGEQWIGITGENSKSFKQRYPDKKDGAQQKIGITGMQAAFDEFLLSERPAKLVYQVDGMGNDLLGNVQYVGVENPYYPLNMRTTMDKKLQENVEKLMDKHGVQKGAVILLDIQNSDIIVMASRPKMNQENPFQDEGVENMGTKLQIPGSIFKTIVAAAAIEEGLDDENVLYDCDQNLYGERDKRPLGMLTFKESFAQSCNRTFADIAKQLKQSDPTFLQEIAKQLSVIDSVGWQGDIYHYSNFKQLFEEQGRVFLENESQNDDQFVAQTAIGQHDVRTTPLAITNMMATIARGGEKKMVKAVSAIEYQNGQTMLHFKNKSLPGKKLSAYTAMKLQHLLREVVQDEKGTGHVFQSLPFEIAGKSGTAETGRFIEEQQLYHKWFAGYFPFQRPKYALTVLNLDVFESEGGINPLFADIVNMVHEYEKNKEE
ncbi:penicillin-binding transpeptidase domain-containing protein [Bacillus chungangensis]|uniref:Cell division protein FtsI/penicillin-binding protein 2 n=1 Tax=Bacillus chungangensis TaxID=587633 RepID=A0ABT9WLX7_9BACI|nr:penicillin-binding transpeptidase domain-containing protein [Bacillus chungangensis]MDQ0174246.1 cell division protein FtsI/penicillin-binding protein 2 [Bacillus chungangensis]